MSENTIKLKKLERKRPMLKHYLPSSLLGRSLMILLYRLC